MQIIKKYQNGYNKFNNAYILNHLKSELYRKDCVNYLKSSEFEKSIEEDIENKVKSIYDNIQIYIEMDKEKIVNYLKNPKGANYPWFKGDVMKIKEEFLDMFCENQKNDLEACQTETKIE